MNSSCSTYKETYENPDRQCWEEKTFGKIKCEAFIDFQCSKSISSLGSIQEEKGKKIFFKQVAGPQSPSVGELFAHVQPFPIFVKNGSPWETLHNDIEQILNRLGYEVTDNSDDAKNIIEADLTLLDVRSEPGGFTDLKGTTRARITFKIILRNNKGDEGWQEEFVGEHQIKVSYFYLEDYAKTLGKAYCESLENFMQAAQGPEFKSKIR